MFKKFHFLIFYVDLFPLPENSRHKYKTYNIAIPNNKPMIKQIIRYQAKTCIAENNNINIVFTIQLYCNSSENHPPKTINRLITSIIQYT